MTQPVNLDAAVERLPDLPRPTVNFADHSYPAYSAAQMRAYAEAALSASNARAEAAEEALRRQTDNMAFVLNRVDLHGFHERFERELAEDRTTLASMKEEG